MVKLASVSLLAFSCVSCATYIKGDLESKNIADVGIAARLSDLEGNKKTGKAYVGNTTYDLDLTYHTGGVGNAAAPYLTMFTLGLIPLYSTNNGDIDVIVRKNGETVLSERLDSRFHTTYGWLAIARAEDSNSSDLMNWNEPSSTGSHVEKTLDERLKRYLKTKLKN